MEQKRNTLEKLQYAVAAVYVFALPFMLFPPVQTVLGAAAGYASNPLLLMMVGILLWLAMGRARLPVQKNPLLKKLVIFSVAMVALSLATSLALYTVLGPLNGENTLRASLPNDFYMLLSIVMFGYNFLVMKTLRLQTLDRIIMALTVVLLVTGYMQIAVLAELPGAAVIYDKLNFMGWLLDAETITRYERVCAVSSEPSHFGLTLATIVCPYVFSRLLLAERRECRKYWTCFVLMLPPLAMTLSSTAYLGVMIDMAAFAVLWIYRKYRFSGKKIELKKLAVLAAGAVLVLILLLKLTPLGYYVGSKISLQNGSLASTIRYSTVLTDLNAFKHYPITGIGNGNQGYFYNETTLSYAPEEYWGYYEFADRLDGSMGIVSGGAFLPAFLSGYGLIGVAFLIWLFVACLRAARKIPEEYRVYQYMYYIGMASFLVLSTATIALEGNFREMFLLSIPLLGAMQEKQTDKEHT